MIDIYDSLHDSINSSVEKIMQEQMQVYISMFRLEVETLNEELAHNTQMHGYDFSTIPEDLVNSLTVEPVVHDDSSYSIRAVFDDSLLDNCSDSLVDFIADYAIGNTNLRYKRYRSGG